MAAGGSGAVGAGPCVPLIPITSTVTSFSLNSTSDELPSFVCMSRALFARGSVSSVEVEERVMLGAVGEIESDSLMLSKVDEAIELDEALVSLRKGGMGGRIAVSSSIISVVVLVSEVWLLVLLGLLRTPLSLAPPFASNCANMLSVDRLRASLTEIGRTTPSARRLIRENRGGAAEDSQTASGDDAGSVALCPGICSWWDGIYERLRTDCAGEDGAVVGLGVGGGRSDMSIFGV